MNDQEMRTAKEREQEREWTRAQQITINFDIRAAAKQHLLFLEVVDRNRWLYGGPALLRAIHRYKVCWLPLLAKHVETQVVEGPLVVPLDCEWIWHCHRINPLRYKSDCEQLFGKILGVSGVVSAATKACVLETRTVWEALYPDEAYEFNLNKNPGMNGVPELSKSTTYDLVSAAERQISFFYQVSRPFVKNDVFLGEAVARYKGFLHLIRRNQEKSIKQFCVPTYDIDLIWHTHQLNPESYCKEVMEAVGKIVEHDDTAADRTKGMKLDVGFSATVKQWEETFGTRYWKAGAMYRGPPPSSPTDFPLIPSISCNTDMMPERSVHNLDIPQLRVVEVYVEITGARNLPIRHKGNYKVIVSKKQSDKHFSDELKIAIQAAFDESKRPAYFLCEPNGELCFKLLQLRSISKSHKIIGEGFFSLDGFFSPISKLAEERWIELRPVHGESMHTVGLRIALSFTVPTEALFVFHFSRSSWLSKTGLGFLEKHFSSKNWTQTIDSFGRNLVSLKLNSCRAWAESKLEEKVITKKRVEGLLKSAETQILAEWNGTEWSLMNNRWHLRFNRILKAHGHIADLAGCKQLKIFEGAKLEFEIKQSINPVNEQGMVTVVEFSEQNPYGKAVALLDLKYGYVKVTEELLVLPSIISAFILRSSENSQDGNASKEQGTIPIEIGPQKLPGKPTSGKCGADCSRSENTAK